MRSQAPPAHSPPARPYERSGRDHPLLSCCLTSAAPGLAPCLHGDHRPGTTTLKRLLTSHS